MTNPTSTTTTSTTSTLAADDPRAVFAAAVALAGETIAAVPADALDAPTPSGMTVGQLLDHLVAVPRRVACAGRGDAPDSWPTDRGVHDGDHLAAWTAAAHECQANWPDEALDRPTTLPWTTLPGREVLDVFTNEISVHTWDLAEGIGVEPAWDEDVIAVAYDAIRRELPAERGPMWEAFVAQLPEGVPFVEPFGDAVAVADDAPLIDRLVAWNGRRP